MKPALGLLLLTACGSLYPEPEYQDQVLCQTERNWSTITTREACEGFKSTADATALALDDSFQATLNVGYQFELHPGSDGGSWEPGPYERDAGYTEIYGQAFCHQKRILLASMDWAWLRARNVACHEGGHAVLGCWWSDHEEMKAKAFGARCNHHQQAASFTGASGGDR